MFYWFCPQSMECELESIQLNGNLEFVWTEEYGSSFIPIVLFVFGCTPPLVNRWFDRSGMFSQSMDEKKCDSDNRSPEDVQQRVV